MTITTARLRRVLATTVAGAALAAGLIVGIAPAEAAAPNCGGRSFNTEYGGSDIDGPNNSSLELVGERWILTVPIPLAQASCSALTYNLVTAAGTTSAAGNDTTTVTLSSDVTGFTYSPSEGVTCVEFAISVTNASGKVLDRAPDAGTAETCTGTGGGQFFR